MMPFKYCLFLALTTFFIPVYAQKKVDILQFVDPMIGTAGGACTFPGATTPLGMVQLSPSDDNKAREFCSGYNYSSSVIKGFAHNHFSGTGLSGMGDILLMPTTGELQMNAGTAENPESGYRSRFSHENERATPGYYSVWLDEPAVKVELTCTPRVGYHRYIFQRAGLQHVIIDPTHNIRESVLKTGIEIISDTEIRGFKFSQGACGKRTVYFYAKFSKPFSISGVTVNDQIHAENQKTEAKTAKAFVTYNGNGNDTVEVKVALSYVDYEGAKANYQAEAQSKKFKTVLAKAQNMWRDKVGKIQIETESKQQARIFYTAMYHAYIAPNIISDVNGNYVVEGKKYTSKGLTQYSNFSTWDTFRALHPLQTIIDQKTDADLINVMISRCTESKVGLYLWEALGHDNFCMIGYPSISAMADAALKNIKGVDPHLVYKCIREAAFDTTKSSPNYDKENGMNYYIKLGYMPAESLCSGSTTTENNYYDWCIAELAQKLGKKDDEKLFRERSVGYHHLFNKNTNYLWPKHLDGTWLVMDTASWTSLRPHYVSGNIWAYSAFTPHDMSGAIKLWGGKKKYAAWLDVITTTPLAMKGEQHVDISGFIGKYAHGDEPGHQIAYLYDFVGQPWKTQSLVREVMNTMYFDNNEGFINNEDCGQMSAWYIFSALGFYPVCPGDLQYFIGTPLYKKAVLNLENGKQFVVTSNNNSAENKYIQSATLNGKPYNNLYINHDEIMAGGELHFEMGPKPNIKWGI